MHDLTLCLPKVSVVKVRAHACAHVGISTGTRARLQQGSWSGDKRGDFLGFRVWIEYTRHVVHTLIYGAGYYCVMS